MQDTGAAYRPVTFADCRSQQRGSSSGVSVFLSLPDRER